MIVKRFSRDHMIFFEVGSPCRKRSVDILAINHYYDHDSIIGFEVKVSRSDFLNELKAPDKAESIKKYCSHWYLVANSESVVKGRGGVIDLPEDWGLIIPTKKNDKLRVKKEAPRLRKNCNIPLPLVARLLHKTADFKKQRRK